MLGYQSRVNVNHALALEHDRGTHSNRHTNCIFRFSDSKWINIIEIQGTNRQLGMNE